MNKMIFNQDPRDFINPNVLMNLNPNVLMNGAIPADIYKDGDVIIIEVELAGVKKEDIEINYVDDSIRISIAKELGARKEGVEILFSHRMGGTATLNFKVSDIDASKIEADFENGLLTVKAPSTKPVEPSAQKIVLK